MKSTESRSAPNEWDILPFSRIRFSARRVPHSPISREKAIGYRQWVESTDQKGIKSPPEKIQFISLGFYAPPRKRMKTQSGIYIYIYIGSGQPLTYESRTTWYARIYTGARALLLLFAIGGNREGNIRAASSFSPHQLSRASRDLFIFPRG